MIPLNKVLVITPARSIKQQVITRAMRLAREQQTQLTLFSVAEELPKEQLAWVTVVPPQEIMGALLEEQHSILEDAAERYRDDYSNIDTSNVSGTPFIEVIKKVKTDCYDLVVLAAKASGRRSKRFFASTTMHLMRKCPCPVWVVGEQEQPTIKRIVAAIDVYAPTEQGLRLNERILQWASKLVTQEKAELHIIHAWQLPGDDYLKGWGFTTEIDRCEMAMKEQFDRQQHLDKLVEK